MDDVKVGMADLATAKAPQGLVTIGLGSCVGICLHDKNAAVGGLAHIMLPDSTQGRSLQNKAKYADTALEVMINDMIKLGAQKRRLTAKIAGGAQMFSFSGESSTLKIGERNVIAVKEELKKQGIPLVAEDTGENYGRTIRFDTQTGSLSIRTGNKGEKVI